MGSAVAAAGIGAAVAIGSCGGDGGKKKPRVETVSTTQAETDAAVLGGLLDMERGAVAGYALIATKLRGESLAVARKLAEHERQHVTALENAIRQVGGTPVPPRPRSEYATSFPTLRGDRDALSFALDVETTAVAAYAEALSKIATDGVRTLAATILGAEAEHAAVMLGQLGRPQVPEPFVTGPPPEEDTP